MLVRLLNVRNIMSRKSPWKASFMLHVERPVSTTAFTSAVHGREVHSSADPRVSSHIVIISVARNANHGNESLGKRAATRRSSARPPNQFAVPRRDDTRRARAAVRSSRRNES